MAFLTLLVVMTGIVGSFGLHFSLTDCAHGPNKALAVSNVHLSVDPVHIGVNEGVTADIKVLHPISGSHYKLDIVIKKKFLFTWFHVPCFQNMGSCSYPDVCNYLTHGNQTLLTPLNGHCPLVRVPASSQPVNCACPLEAGSYHLNNPSYHFVILHGVLAAMAAGDYKIDATITNTNTNATVACVHIQVTTVT